MSRRTLEADLVTRIMARSIDVGCERCDVDQGGYPVVCSGVRDQGTAVRVADEDDGAADPPEAAGDAVYIAFQGV